jgi:hypothetical protein
MSVYRAQAHLDAPVEDVWALVGNPATYPEWCPTTGGFQRWLLTDAQGGTFVDMEMGIDAPTFRYGLFDKTLGRWFIKRWAEQAIDGLRRTLTN